MEKCDKVLIGGGMVFTFYKARGLSVGKSLVEDDKLELARELEATAKARGVELLLPTDVVVADRFAADAASRTVPVDAIPEGWMGLDIGPDSVAAFQKALADCRTVIWNGPMGVFEFDAFAAGTNSIAMLLAELSSAEPPPSLAGVIPSPRWKKLVWPARCPTFPPVGAPAWSCWRARSCLVLPHWTTRPETPCPRRLAHTGLRRQVGWSCCWLAWKPRRLPMRWSKQSSTVSPMGWSLGQSVMVCSLSNSRPRTMAPRGTCNS